jgi:hypothetical protein
VRRYRGLHPIFFLVFPSPPASPSRLSLSWLRSMSTQNLLTGACTSSAPTPPEAEGGDRTPLADAANAAEELYRLRDTFFPRDPAEKAAALRARADAALALLDALPSGTRRPLSSQLPLSFVFLHLIQLVPHWVVVKPVRIASH